MQEPFALNKFEHHTFLASIHTKVLGGVLNLKKLAVEFKMDVELNKERTMIKQNSLIIDKSVKICSTRSKNKQVVPNTNGFVKLSYPDDQESMYYTNPPDIIPIDCYCRYCDKEGPYAHCNYCKKPKKNQLHITIDAFIDSVYSGPYKVRGHLAEYSVAFCQILKENKIDSKNYKANIDEIIKNLPSELYENLFISDRRHMSISLSDILVLTKKDKDGKFFTGPIMIKYKLGTKNVTMRIRKNGNVELISNPWYSKYTYQDILKKINDTSQKVEFIEGDIRTFFSSVNLFNYPNYTLDLMKVFQYLWPITTTYPKYQIGKGYYIFSENENILYKYEIKTDKNSKSRLYIELVKCIRQDNEIIVGNYKISVQLFAQGHLQTTFGYYSDNAPKYNLDEQFDIIQNLFVEVQQLFVYYLSKLILVEKDLVVSKEKKKVSKKIFETVIGIMPYAKRKKFRIGDKCNVFNYGKKVWSTTEWIITNVETVEVKESELDIGAELTKEEEEANEAKVDKEDKVLEELPFYNVADIDMPTLDILVPNSTSSNQLNQPNQPNQPNKIFEIMYTLEISSSKKTKKIKKCRHSDLRKVEPNNDQVCRLNENGIPRQPYPYSFYGSCPGGLDQYINPIGLISRSDNNFYPFSETVSADDEKWIINFLLNGFTRYEIIKGFFDKMKNGVDIYCGTFKPGTALIGSIVDIQHPTSNEFVNVQIIDKNKTHGLGNDNNNVIYKVTAVDGIDCLHGLDNMDMLDILDEDDESLKNYFEITGANFNKHYLENRYFRGIMNMNIDQHELLLRCAKKLHLIGQNTKIEKEKEFKETHLSKYNIQNLCSKEIKNVAEVAEEGAESTEENKEIKGCINYVIVVPEYLEECEKCILYVIFRTSKEDQTSKEIIYSFNKNAEEDEMCSTVLKIYGYYKETENKFYPVKMLKKIDEQSGDYEHYEHHIVDFAGEVPNHVLIDSKQIRIVKDHISYKSIFKFVSRAINIKDYVYNNMPYIIVFSVGKKLYKWSTINRNTINLEVKEIVNGKIKTKINFKKYSNFDYKLSSLISSDNQKLHAKVGDMISFKPNIMYDGSINPIVPILDLKISEKGSKETSEDTISYIFGKLNIEVFKKKKWKVGNDFNIIEIMNNEDKSILIKEII